MKNSINFFLLLLFVPVFYLTAQDTKELKACMEEGKIHYTPQLAGSNPASKPASVRKSARSYLNASMAASQVQQTAKKNVPMTWPQLAKKMSAAKNMLNEVAIYSGPGDQRSPQIVTNIDEKFIVFENDDTEGGTYPYGTIDVYQSSDGGANWSYFNGLYNSVYRLSAPQILLIGTDVIVSYLSNGTLWTYKWGRSNSSITSSEVPIPAISTDEYVIDYKIVSDIKEYSTDNYLYMAFLFRQVDGKNRVLFSASTDTARTWDSFIELGISQSELGASSLGFDYSSSGLFVAYLGTDTSAGSILMRKSVLFGLTWSPEVKLPMHYNGGMNKKVGPAVSAMGSRVAVVYQYDFYGDATDWKTASDFDIYAIVSYDGGESWEERMVNSTYSSEILPSVTCDYDENFYVSFIRNGRANVSMAGQEYAFGVADSSLTTKASLNDFPSIYGAAVPYNNSAYIAWTEGTDFEGLDILGAETVLKIPPASPADLDINSISTTEVKLTWTDNSIDEIGFVVYSRQTVTEENFKQVEVVGANVTSVNISGLTPSIEYDFYVRAFNENGYSLRTNIETIYPSIVDNTPPTIVLNAPTGTPVIVLANGQVSSTPEVHATATDGESGVYQMQVAYRNTSEQTWSKSPLVDGNSINYPIPTGAFVLNNKPIGVNYCVGAWDNEGNVAWSEYASIEAQLGPQATDQPSFTMPAASALENKTTAYRMISVPYNLANKQPVKLLSDFGEHTENNVAYARWRFQRYINGQYEDYDQFSTNNVVTPGAAFFFIVRDQGSQIVVQGESINRSDILYNTGITLQNGWNLVGNPFIHPYPLDSLEFFAVAAPAVQASIRQFAFYSGSGPVSGWDTARVSINSIKPWSGVALFVSSAGTLKFPSTGQHGGLPKASVRQSVKTAVADWTLAINAYRPEIGMRCEGSSIGFAKGASEGDDSYDLYIPPIIGDKNVAVYFKNSDGAMMRDIRPVNNEGSVWDMRVVTGDGGARVKLQWSDNLNLPDPAFEAYLIDNDQKMAYNLKETKSLEINSGNGVRSFRVVIGKKSFVEGNNAGVALKPSSMKLYANYPNPFNPETVIRYCIPETPESYTVTLKVFNVLGQEIATLVNERKAPGYYEAKFNGANQSSGIYFYQLSVTGGSKTFSEIKKMVLMR